MRTKFSREPKEMTTEPSADKLAHEGMKRGGHAKHKAMGGAMMPMPTREMPMREQMPMRSAMPKRRAVAMQPALLTRKHGGKAHHAEGGEVANEGDNYGYEVKPLIKPYKPPIKKAHGGEVESKAMERKEEREIHKVEKELKHHESMGAKKAHHGLKKGGMYSPQIGGLLDEGHPHHKGRTGSGVEGPGFKHGGKIHHVSGHPEGSHEHHKHMAKHHLKMHKEGGSAHHKKMHEHHKAMCGGGKMAEGGTMPMVKHGGEQLKHGGKAHHKYAKGGEALAVKGDKFQTEGTRKPKIDVQDKVHEAKQTKSFHTKTGGIELEGYKRGGKMHKYAKGGTISKSVANRHLNDMEDGSKPHKKAGKTGEIHEAPAGYKKGGHVKHHAHGGHVAHHTTMGHSDAGHTHMHEHTSKHEHGHEKITAHPMKRGGVAHKKHHKNY
jgi:hypothetical protein